MALYDGVRGPRGVHTEKEYRRSVAARVRNDRTQFAWKVSLRQRQRFDGAANGMQRWEEYSQPITVLPQTMVAIASDHDGGNVLAREMNDALAAASTTKGRNEG